LKRLAIEFDLAKEGAKAPAISKLFVDNVNKNGRVSEAGLVSKFLLKTNPLGILKMIPRASKLLIRGRMQLTAHKIEGIPEVEKCLAAAASLGLHPGLTGEE
jgi:hypothetical protein